MTTISARADLIDANGNVQVVIPAVAGVVDFKGAAAERLGADFTVVNPDFVPTGPSSPFDPRAGLRIRAYWREMVSSSWVDTLVGTFHLGNVKIRDDRNGLSITLPGRDVLSEAARGGYRGTLNLGGLNGAEALRALFSRIAPWAVVVVGTTSISLPNPYTVGGSTRRPQEDWTKIADLLGWRVYGNLLGVIVCGPVTVPPEEPLNWQEGPLCKVVDLDRDIDYLSMINSVTATSTSPEVDPPISVTVEDTDPGSPTYVGNRVWGADIESDLYTTEESARNAARAEYDRLRRPMDTVQVSAFPNPNLAYQTRVNLFRARAGVAGEYSVSSYRLPLETPGDKGPQLMTVGMAPRGML